MQRLFEQDLYSYSPSAINTLAKYYRLSGDNRDELIPKIAAKIIKHQRAKMPGENITGIPEVDWQILLKTRYKDLRKMCTTNKAIAEICESDAFWIQKLKQDYNVDSNPRDFYQMLRWITKNINYNSYDVNFSEQLQFAILSENPRNIRYMEFTTDDAIISIIKEFPEILKYIDNPSLKVIEKVLELYPSMINVIGNEIFEDLSTQDQIALFKKYPQILQYVEDFDPELQMIIVRDDPTAINFIDNPTPEVQMYIVEQDPKLISNIVNPDESVQMYVVRKDPELVAVIKNPTKYVQRFVVQQNPELIKDIKNPDSHTQTLAVQQDPLVVNYIKNPSKNMIDLVAEKIVEDPQLAAQINNKKILLAALKKDVNLIRNIKNPNAEMKNYIRKNAPELAKELFPSKPRTKKEPVGPSPITRTRLRRRMGPQYVKTVINGEEMWGIKGTPYVINPDIKLVIGKIDDEGQFTNILNDDDYDFITRNGHGIDGDKVNFEAESEESEESDL